ncbi:MAG TPA: hypothetical protein VN108_09155, partial [Marmoricola sp.]|nr:hypothetical protein [Marmoricola sp.]
MTRARTPKHIFRILAVAVVAASGWASQASPAAAFTSSVTIYASPTGSGTSCVSWRPCSLTTAQGQARTAARNAQNATV